MFITELNLSNFRNYEKLNISLDSGINIIYGKNGYGKTNILESMFLCCIGKSFRTNHDVEMIKSGEQKFDVKVKLSDNLFGSIEVSYDKNKSKVVIVDGVCINKLRLLMGKMHGILFSPETLSLINDGPSERRKFMDVALCQLSGNYYYSLIMYNKAVQEKNALLSDRFSSVDKISLDVYNEQLADFGSFIIASRYNYMKKINEFASELYNEISDSSEKIGIKYVTNSSNILKSNEEFDINKLKSDLYDEISSERNISREKDLGRCIIGPHRDDFETVLNDFSLKSFGSQGQKRSAAVAMKIAEIEIMKEKSGKTPILFLDDVLSELDNMRKNKIIELTKNYQTFITCTDRDVAEDLLKKKENVKYINVEQLR